MIQPNDAIIQSNAVAALSASSQPRRAHLAMHAYEIWPYEPEVLDKPLQNKDERFAPLVLPLYALLSPDFARNRPARESRGPGSEPYQNSSEGLIRKLAREAQDSINGTSDK